MAQKEELHEMTTERYVVSLYSVGISNLLADAIHFLL